MLIQNRGDKISTSVNAHPSRIDHDVGRWRLCIAVLLVSLASLGSLDVVPTAALLHPEALVDDTEEGHHTTQSKPEPAQLDVPWVVEKAEERREEGEYACTDDDEDTTEEAGDAPLALARHGYQNSPSPNSLATGHSE